MSRLPVPQSTRPATVVTDARPDVPPTDGGTTREVPRLLATGLSSLLLVGFAWSLFQCLATSGSTFAGAPQCMLLWAGTAALVMNLVTQVDLGRFTWAMDVFCAILAGYMIWPALRAARTAWRAAWRAWPDVRATVTAAWPRVRTYAAIVKDACVTTARSILGRRPRAEVAREDDARADEGPEGQQVDQVQPVHEPPRLRRRLAPAPPPAQAPAAAPRRARRLVQTVPVPVPVQQAAMVANAVALRRSPRRRALAATP